MYDTVSDALTALENCICASCFVTQSEIKQQMHEAGETDNFAIEYESETGFPDDYDEYSNWTKIQILLDTACGCEYEIVVVDDD